MPLYGLSVLGNRHAQTLSIMEDTGSNIYLPSPWCKITQPSDAESESIIHVTGNTIEEVQKATTLLKKLLPQKVFYIQTFIYIYIHSCYCSLKKKKTKSFFCNLQFLYVGRSK